MLAGTKSLSRQKLYLWQLPPMIGVGRWTQQTTVLAGSAQWLAGLLGDNTTPCPGRNSGPVGRGPMAGTVDRLSVTVLSEKAQEFWLFMAD